MAVRGIYEITTQKKLVVLSFPSDRMKKSENGTEMAVYNLSITYTARIKATRSILAKLLLLYMDSFSRVTKYNLFDRRL